MFDINEFWNSEIKLSDVMGGPKSTDILIEPLKVSQIGYTTNNYYGNIELNDLAITIEFGFVCEKPHTYYANNINISNFKIKNPNINNNLCIMQTLFFTSHKHYSIGLMLSDNDYNKLTSFANKYADDLIEFLKSASLFA